MRKLKSAEMGRELVKHWLKYNYFKSTILIILRLKKIHLKCFNWLLAVTCVTSALWSLSVMEDALRLIYHLDRYFCKASCYQVKRTCLCFWGQVFKKYLLSALFFPYGAVHPARFIRVYE